MSMLSVDSARRIAKDLNKKRSKHLEKRVEKLQKKTVTVELLREVELEEALCRHAWHPELKDKVQGLLMKYFRMIRIDDEAREQKMKEEEEARIEAEKAILPVIEKENVPKKTVPKLVIKLPVPGSVQPQEDNDVQVIMVIKNAPRNTTSKRKIESGSMEEPMSKRIRKDELKNVDSKENIAPAKENKTEKAVEEPKKVVGANSGKIPQNQKKPVEIKKTVEKTTDSKKSNEDRDKVITRIVKKINKLPGILAPSDIDKFQKGVSACDLQEAEKRFGRNLKRLNRVWWFLLERDFKISRQNSVCEPRVEYFKQQENLINSLFD